MDKQPVKETMRGDIKKGLGVAITFLQGDKEWDEGQKELFMVYVHQGLIEVNKDLK